MNFTEPYEQGSVLTCILNKRFTARNEINRRPLLRV